MTNDDKMKQAFEDGKPLHASKQQISKVEAIYLMGCAAERAEIVAKLESDEMRDVVRNAIAKSRWNEAQNVITGKAEATTNALNEGYAKAAITKILEVI
jgi:hypothetical protein